MESKINSLQITLLHESEELLLQYLCGENNGWECGWSCAAGLSAILGLGDAFPSAAADAGVRVSGPGNGQRALKQNALNSRVYV